MVKMLFFFRQIFLTGKYDDSFSGSNTINLPKTLVFGRSDEARWSHNLITPYYQRVLKAI
jgi:hypothetical protein